MRRLMLVFLLLAAGVMPAVAQTPEPPVALVEFISEVFDIKGVRPDWNEASPGVYARGESMLDPTSVIIQTAPAMTADQLGSLLTGQLQIEALPEPSDSLQSDALEWALYEVTVGSGALSIYVDIALADDDDRAYVVLMQASQNVRESLYDDVFVPVVESIRPLGEDEHSLPSYADMDAFTETDIVFGGEEFPLEGTLTMPEGEGPFPAVVVVAGSGPNQRDGTIGGGSIYRDLAYGLASQGIASIRYDKRTYSYGPAAAPDGFDIDDEVTEDAIYAIDYLHTVDAVDTDSIFVVGHSQGGMLAPRIAQQDGRVAGIVMMAAPARPFDEVVSEQVEYIAEVNPAASDEALEQLRDLANTLRALRTGEGLDDIEIDAGSRAYYESLANVDAVADAQALDIPILVMQGERDYQVTVEDFTLWEDALADQTADFISYPSLQHTFMAMGDQERLSIPQDYAEAAFVDEQVISDLASWIHQHSE